MFLTLLKLPVFHWYYGTAVILLTDATLGRLEVTTELVDTDNDGEYEELYSYGHVRLVFGRVPAAP